MSLLIKSGKDYFEVSDSDLATCEVSPERFELRAEDALVADGNLIADTAVPLSLHPDDPVPIGSGCTGPTYGASCGKAPNCP